MTDRDETEQLRRAQARRSQLEGALAQQAQSEEDQLMHARRAEKAAYLREQLDRQAQASEAELDGEA